MKQRKWISLAAVVALLLSLIAVFPIAGVLAADGDPEIGLMVDFADLTQWKSQAGSDPNVYTLADEGSHIKVSNISENKYGATIAPANFNGQYNTIGYQVTVNVDEYPYFYTKYAYAYAESGRFQMVLHTGDSFWHLGNNYTSYQVWDGTPHDIANSPNLTIDGNYYRYNLKAEGLSGEQTFWVTLNPNYSDSYNTWDISYMFFGTDGNLKADDTVANYVPGASEEETDAEIGLMVDFADLTQWYSQEGSAPNTYTLADAESYLKISNISENKYGATIAPSNFNGQFNMAARQVTVNVDEYPYFYTKYTYAYADAARFQMLLHTEEGFWIVGQNVTTYSLGSWNSADANMEYDGEYYRYDLKAAGLSGEQTFWVCLCPNYSDSYNTWDIAYMFFGTAGKIQAENAVANYVPEVPEESTPEESIPEESIPEESIPEESTPEESIPEESTPEESIPEESIPEESTPEEEPDFTKAPTAGHIIDFSDLTKWKSQAGSDENVYTLADADSYIKISDITEDKYGATIYPASFNGQYNTAGYQVTVNVDEYPYFYAKYNYELAEAARFQLALHTAESHWHVNEVEKYAQVWDAADNPNLTKQGDYYRYDLKAAGFSGEQTFWVTLNPNYTDSYNRWNIEYMFFGTAGKIQAEEAVGRAPVEGGTETKIDLDWSMDLSDPDQVGRWILHGDHSQDGKFATYSHSMKDILAGTDRGALAFTVGGDNGNGGTKLNASFDYSVPGAVFYQFLGIQLTVDVDQNPYLYFQGTFSKADMFNVYLNDVEISGNGNGVMGDGTLHEPQVLDLKAHYGSGVHTFYVIAYFFDGDGADDKPFTIDYMYLGDENDAPKPVPKDEEESEPEESKPGESEPDESEPEDSTPTLEDLVTGITISGELDAGLTLRVNPITEGDDLAWVEYCLNGSLKSYDIYDITVNNFGIATSLDKAVDFAVPLSDAMKDCAITVYYVTNDGKLVEMVTEVKDGKVLFTTAETGLFVIGTNGEPAAPENSDAEEDKNPETGVPVAFAALALLTLSGATVVVSRKKR